VRDKDRERCADRRERDRNRRDRKSREKDAEKNIQGGGGGGGSSSSRAAAAASSNDTTSFMSSHIKCSCNCTMVLIDCPGHTEVVCHTLEVCVASLSCVDGL